MSEFQPTRHKTDLAEVVEMLLEKGIVINADIAVSIGDTQLLGIQVRAAIASFETAAKYGLEFPEGTDMRRVAEAVGDPELAEEDRPRVPIDPTRGVNVSAEDEASEKAEDGSNGEGFLEEERGGPEGTDFLGARPDPVRPMTGESLFSEQDGENADEDDENEEMGDEDEERTDDETDEGTDGESDADDGDESNADGGGDEPNTETDDESGDTDGDD